MTPKPRSPAWPAPLGGSRHERGQPRPDFAPAREKTFQAEIAAFVADNLPGDIRHDHELGRSDHVRWQRKLVARGWRAPRWPEARGGAGGSMRQRFVFEEAMSALGAPAFNTRMIGPILLAHGDEAQKRRFLPRALNVDDGWRQGCSEPGAGSDLASLWTGAVREGDHYVVNGSKI